MKDKFAKKILSNLNLVLLIVVFLLGTGLVLPVLSRIPNHSDENQFYANAFSIMAGKELANYIHVALTEYALAGFFTVVNIFTDSGVNFPQGDPTMVTFYYGKLFGFILYILTFILGCLILQREERKIKIRTVIFAVLYFGSLGIFERFLRVNSDSISIFVFFNFIILSFWLHRQKASVLKFFLLNLAFIFLGTFTNFKTLFLMFPLAFLNTVSPFIWYEETKKDQGIKLQKSYRFIWYVLGIVAGGVVLWAAFIPKPFSYVRFWYSLKRIMTYETKFDFNYPSQSFGSWKVYIYDLLAEYIGLTTVLALGILATISFKLPRKLKAKNLFRDFLFKARAQIRFSFLKEGNLYPMTEFILLLSFVLYYLGVSLQVVHWSRWGAPLGILAMMILGAVVEKLLESIWRYETTKDKVRPKLTILLPSLFFLAWVLRIFLTIDLFKTNSPSEGNGFKQTFADVGKLLKKEGISPKDGLKKVTWFSGYTSNVNNISLENLVDERNKDTKYILWPYWNIALLYTKKNVDLETHNQRAFVDKYAEKIWYRFPTFLSYYMHFTKYFAVHYLGLTWNPEIDSLVESQYGIVKLKEPVKNIELVYEVPFKDMSHYYFPYSLIFNMKNLTDSYMYPPCYTYPSVKLVKDGSSVDPPPEIGIGGRTAGLYCHSVRFRILFKGTYRIRIEGLPKDPKGIQKVFSNMDNFNWDPETKTIILDMPITFLPGDFGVATKESNIKNLKFWIFYRAK